MAEKKKKEETSENIELTPQLEAKREKKKSRWTLELCKKYAKRFHSIDEWRFGSPSCYKAAVARGWEKECAAVMQPLVKSPKARPAKPQGKQVAPKKTKVG